MGDGEILKLLRRSDDAGAPSYQPQEETAGSKLLKNRLYQFIEPQVITFVEQILSETEKKLDIHQREPGQSGKRKNIQDSGLLYFRKQSDPTV